MKLEVGMYVRTDNGIIGKIYEKIGDMFTYKDSNRDYITYGLTHNEILKASFNIIDLIEVGDYVNGFRVDEIGEYHSIRTDKVETYAKVNCSALLNCFYEEDIKSIVTKEMFLQMEYKVGE